MASFQTIALELKISKQTVSRAFRNHPYVKEELREKIFAVANRQGYRPDPKVASLMSYLRQDQSLRRQESIAVMHYDYTREVIAREPAIQSLLSGIRGFGDEHGFHAEEFWLSDKGMTSARLERIFRARGIKGVIIMPVNLRSHGHLTIDPKEFSTVVLGVGLVAHDVNRVHHDHYWGMVTALRELRHLGYHRIGFLCHAIVNERSGRAYEAAFHTFHPLPPLVRSSLFRTYREEPLSQIKKWIRTQKLDVLITDFPFPARWLGSDGKSIRSTMPLISLDLGDDHESSGGIVQEYEKIGETAMRLLAAQLVQYDTRRIAAAMIVRHEGRWVNRNIPRFRSLAKNSSVLKTL